MKTSEFLELLREHSSKALVFEYGSGQRIGANYHITEVKNISVESVDCGGRSDSWRETVIQLWENPGEADKRTYLSTYKARAILDRVHALKPMDTEAVLRFEYGNSSFHTAQLYVKGAKTDGRELTFTLQSAPTLCKAEETCGVTKVEEPAGSGCCDPASGCC
ncbi:hypothetical protein SAMN06265375_101828 [Muriicola jejuensis]|uniref:Uncharacterized protein n=1 Tax=Muriicola jejuensis TaxID=504488 RepID=A0A6P0UHN6_9FLAO|nr:DUF6428 family protein [Muriicola jejuensis]NER09656.1 hypothetical protein [Muriicola jejuensis]SMP06914.1 hypothetical protein SAMN06265375_101828 [Muriicola jejuensis]